MKKTTITHVFTPRLMPISENVAGGKTLRMASDCLNMRAKADASTNMLVPVGIPKLFVDGEFKPFFSYKHAGGGESIFMTVGNFLYVKLGDGVPEQLALLPSTPSSAVAIGNKVCIMTQSGPKWTKFDSGTEKWIYMGLKPEFPVIRFSAVESRQFSASTEGRYLTGDYSHWTGRLNDEDTSAVTADLKALYTELSSRAMQMGYYLQPVIVRYRLFDEMGVMLHESAPVLISLPSGFQCASSLAANVGVEGGRYCNFEGFVVEATGFRLGIEAPDLMNSPWGDVVKSVEISVSPQLHPVDYNAQASHRLENATATEGTLRAYIPGMACEMVADTPRRENLVKAMIMDFSTQAKVLAVIHNPFTGGIAGSFTFQLSDYNDAPSECRSLSKLLSDRRLPASESSYEKTLKRAISLPHTFSAMTAINTGDLISWGGIIPIRYGGYPIKMFTAETTRGEWRANIKVSFADGEETVVWHGEGADNAPVAFSPVLSYPHPDALQMTITVSYADGVVLSRTFDLSPLGDRAVFIDSSFSPLFLTEEKEAYVVPAVKQRRDLHSGTIITSMLSSPMEITSVLQVTQGDIVAISPAVRSSSAWDFARTHLYAYSTTGVYAVAINSARNALAAHLMDARGVLRHEAVVATDGAVMAIAGGDLVGVSGSRVKTVLSATDFKKIGWNVGYRELWCVNEEGDVKVLSDAGAYRRDIKVDEMFTSSDGQLYILSEGKLLDATIELSSGAIDLYWRARILSDEIVGSMGMRRFRLARPQLITWLLFSLEADLRLSLRGDSGAGGECSCPIVKLQVKGSLKAPIPARIVAPARLALEVEISGKVSSDTHFNSVQMLLSK